MTILEYERPLTIKVTDRASMDHELDAAVSTLREQAAHDYRRRGILVTRHSSGEFTAALSDTVPFGLTQELQAW